MDILINRTLYMSRQAGPGFEPRTVHFKSSEYWANVADHTELLLMMSCRELSTLCVGCHMVLF